MEWGDIHPVSLDQTSGHDGVLTHEFPKVLSGTMRSKVRGDPITNSDTFRDCSDKPSLVPRY